ncbi:hypothetical protein [Parenemella sanctibonifatiensis]|uniref:Uncharacterized protein n=1 Tax=Parenemella sanctibonifatiensis TaxID=2016505 RepID=A0A255EDH5_9ACTN|nr:hypothetical protein [Parenemella sanctibonifatiensis]OYN88991.1 hypothetical protein CGZ91_11990 [Parenemella sanctibonifatiensis]
MSEASNEQVQHAYEAYTKHTLQTAVNYIEGDPAVDTIWIYTLISHGALETTAFFRFNGKFVDAYDLAEADANRDYDPHQLVSDLARDEHRALGKALKLLPQPPERIITTYNPQSGEVKGDWDYGGVILDEDDTPGRARDRWITSMGGTPLLT